MHHLNLIAAVGLLASSAVQAAPRAMSSEASDVTSQSTSFHAYVVNEEHSVPEVVPRGMQFAHSVEAPAPTDCPAPVVVVTTTTIDVTIYVTPKPTSTEPCDDDTTTMVTATATSTVRHWQKANSTMPETPSTVPMSTSQWNTTATTTKTPEKPQTTMSTTEPCDEETPTPTPTPTPCDEGMTWSSGSNSTMIRTASTQTTMQKPQTTDCVIDTSMAPVSTSTMTATAAMTAQPTKTQCVHDEPTGKPAGDSMYCGIHGKPAGTYFIAEFIENKPGEAVTEEGCYQFCDSVMESTKGCQSYRFYKNQLGAPRCSLYGRGVAQSVDDLDKNQPDVWYDLSCGSPTAEKWHENMPADHGKRAIAT